MAAQLAAQLVSASTTRELGGFNDRFDDSVDVLTHGCHPRSTALRPKSAATADVLTGPGAGPSRSARTTCAIVQPRRRATRPCAAQIGTYDAAPRSTSP